MLVSKNRIHLSENVLDWIHSMIGAPGIRLQSLIPEIVVDSTNLPGEFHADPADRIIVATARYLNIPLLTFDKKILQYAADGFVKTIAPE